MTQNNDQAQQDLAQQRTGWAHERTQDEPTAISVRLLIALTVVLQLAIITALILFLLG